MQVYEPDETQAVAYELKHGRAAIVPTDTQLGIVCADAKLIYAIKDRPRKKKLVTFVPDASFVPAPGKLFLDLAERFWPGALTLVAAGRSWRAPDHRVVQELLRLAGPLWSSSANVSGQPPLRRATDALNEPRFRERQADLVVVCGEAAGEIPSTVFDVDRLAVLRRGALFAPLTAFLREHAIVYADHEK